MKTYEIHQGESIIRLYAHIIKSDKLESLETWFDLHGQFENIPPKNYEIIEDLKEFFDSEDNFAKLESLLWKQ